MEQQRKTPNCYRRLERKNRDKQTLCEKLNSPDPISQMARSIGTIWQSSLRNQKYYQKVTALSQRNQKAQEYYWGTHSRIKKNRKRVLRRRKSESLAEKNKVFLSLVEEIKSEHPLWGYRRVWAYLRFRQGIEVNKKRIYRFMKEHNLLVTKANKNRAKKTSNRSKPMAKCSNQF